MTTLDQLDMLHARLGRSALLAGERMDIGPAEMRAKAAALLPDDPWALLFLAREVVRAEVLAKPDDWAAVVGLGLLDGALAIQRNADCEARRRRDDYSD